ncbi:flagellar hook-basal body protein [Brevibacillus porteri]|uniref:Flagellar hook-basal body protein n=1 Tax=Brevibacillus porteri TaxID=2126350 RepID=A0ABX5FHX0_9BACL|nr:flagellar hook-basal body protein [Brevibacillus porteri]MED1798202.1 flagellar hook-basal body protein [Brevibacillus porteri]MED2133883.1 flagellar hook-basal body protein [Brevibacillus porteri]MED2743239.1 flagellar hook-basal body protein [Brevibacillus porteri]MED2815427.1 flagellar hook-basal body protein [Brevibacillus porteri]MED2892201.1 flagellar hook-basal body protein [Brevibacillus porteri]
MQSLNISTSAMRGIQQALDNTANNLANIDTIGYKRRVASFSELLSDSMNEQPAADNQNRNTSVGIRIGSGARLGMTKLDLGHGSVKVTDVPTDVLVEGNGYFLVTHKIKDATGNVIQEENRLTRDGSFKVSFDDDEQGYVLHTTSGHILTDENGVNIVLPEPVTNIQITAEGALTANGVSYGNIGLWKVDNPDQLQQVGQNLFDAELDSGANPTTKYTNALITGDATLRQGALEGSNVSMTEEMSQLVNIQRAYQLNSRAVGISDQMMGIANQLRSR